MISASSCAPADRMFSGISACCQDGVGDDDAVVGAY
jgi:hypothetical protein